MKTLLFAILSCVGMRAACDPFNAQRALRMIEQNLQLGSSVQAKIQLANLELMCPANPGIASRVAALRVQLEKLAAETAVEAAKAESVSPYSRRKFALIVGVGDYKDKSISPLQYAAKDASDFRDMLSDPEVGRFSDPALIHMLTGAEATTFNIRTRMDAIAKQAGPEDLVTFYVSTHGTDVNMENVREEARLGYIVTHDTVPSNLYASALPMTELREWMQRLRAARVVGFLDTCYAGGVAPAKGAKSGTAQKLSAASIRSAAEARAKALILDETPAGVPTGVKLVRQDAGRIIISSSTANEQSWESKALDGGRGNSYFTRHLIDAFRSMSAAGEMPDVASVFGRIRVTVAEAVLDKHGASQTPQLFTAGVPPKLILGAPVLPAKFETD